MILFDIISIGGGLVLIIAPKWAYEFGNKNAREMPKNWPVISRIAGVVFIGLGLLFMYLGRQ